jgi:hypothetical protein
MDRVHGSWTTAALVHGGPTTMASHRARRSLFERSLRGMVARRRSRNGERGAWGVHLRLTRVQVVVWWPGDSGEETADETLSVGSARA